MGAAFNAAAHESVLVTPAAASHELATFPKSKECVFSPGKRVVSTVNTAVDACPSTGTSGGHSARGGAPKLLRNR